MLALTALDEQRRVVAVMCGERTVVPKPRTIRVTAIPDDVFGNAHSDGEVQRPFRETSQHQGRPCVLHRVQIQ